MEELDESKSGTVTGLGGHEIWKRMSFCRYISALNGQHMPKLSKISNIFIDECHIFDITTATSKSGHIYRVSQEACIAKI
jgi:hypothetical protein